MVDVTNPAPALSEQEWDIILELLEREGAELPVEIRHTFRHAFRSQLQQRLKTVESLTERLRTWRGNR